MKISTLIIFGSILVGLGGLSLVLAADPSAQIAADSTDPSVLGRQEIDLGARFNLLKELTARHQQRAQAARTTNSPARADWEMALSRELADEASKAAAELDSVTRRRVALEQTNQAAATIRLLSLTTDENAYVSKMSSMLWNLEQEILSLSEASRDLTAQLQTNTEPEDLARISGMLMDQNFSLRLLERERQHMELEQLRFKMIKRR